MHMESGSIILIGLRASGKSTAAAIIAAQLGCPMIDLDHVVAQRANLPAAADLIARDGIDAFRIAESQALAAIMDETGTVVLALGGGTPTAPHAAGMLRAAARRGIRIVYLRATPTTLRTRLAQTDLSSRPSLTGAGTLDEVKTLFDARDWLYQELASTIINVDDLSPHQAAAMVLGS